MTTVNSINPSPHPIQIIHLFWGLQEQPLRFSLSLCLLPASLVACRSIRLTSLRRYASHHTQNIFNSSQTVVQSVINFICKHTHTLICAVHLYLLIHWLTAWLLHSLTHSLTHSLIHCICRLSDIPSEKYTVNCGCDSVCLTLCVWVCACACLWLMHTERQDSWPWPWPPPPPPVKWKVLVSCLLSVCVWINVNDGD